MFRGNHPTRVDEKGRLKLPADFKRLVDEQYGTQFYITSKDGRVAEIYPLQEWEKIEAKLRLLLPQILRESAKVMGDVVVFGMQTYLEVTNHDAFRQNMDSNPLTAEDEQALAGFGL